MYVRYVVMFMKVMRLPQSAPSVTLPLPTRLIERDSVRAL